MSKSFAMTGGATGIGSALKKLRARGELSPLYQNTSINRSTRAPPTQPPKTINR